MPSVRCMITAMMDPGYSTRVEEKMTNAIQSVISEEKAKIAVLTGYGETSPEDLINLLEANQFEVTSQSLLTEEIDPDAESAILFAPQNDRNRPV